MNRRRTDFQALDVDAWPSVAYTEFGDKDRRAFQLRVNAVERYAQGESIGDIELATGVNRRQLYRLLDRGLAQHPDGRICGFRALLKHVRISEYVRTSPVKVHGDRGAAGALSLLLERYPTLAAWLLLQVKQRRVLLQQVGTDGRLRTRLRGLRSLHDEFLRQCRVVGIAAADRRAHRTIPKNLLLSAGPVPLAARPAPSPGCWHPWAAPSRVSSASNHETCNSRKPVALHSLLPAGLSVGSGTRWRGVQHDFTQVLFQSFVD
jgi:hypothetical protein